MRGGNARLGEKAPGAGKGSGTRVIFPFARWVMSQSSKRDSSRPPDDV